MLMWCYFWLLRSTTRCAVIDGRELHSNPYLVSVPLQVVLVREHKREPNPCVLIQV